MKLHRAHRTVDDKVTEPRLSLVEGRVIVGHRIELVKAREERRSSGWEEILGIRGLCHLRHERLIAEAVALISSSDLSI